MLGFELECYGWHFSKVHVRSLIKRGRAVEQMPYRGASAQDRHAFAKYMEEVKRGKSLLALIAMRSALTLEVRVCWHEGAFGAITLKLFVIGHTFPQN
jgi:hypothetical protein